MKRGMLVLAGLALLGGAAFADAPCCRRGMRVRGRRCAHRVTAWTACAVTPPATASARRAVRQPKAAAQTEPADLRLWAQTRTTTAQNSAQPAVTQTASVTERVPASSMLPVPSARR